MRLEGLPASLCPVCGGPRKASRTVCSPRCRAKRHRQDREAKVREVRELLVAALKRLEDSGG
jgi:predicted nucleic acid-binding Zn ribbon protein